MQFLFPIAYILSSMLNTILTGVFKRNAATAQAAETWLFLEILLPKAPPARLVLTLILKLHFYYLEPWINLVILTLHLLMLLHFYYLGYRYLNIIRSLTWGIDIHAIFSWNTNNRLGLHRKMILTIHIHRTRKFMCYIRS